MRDFGSVGIVCARAVAPSEMTSASATATLDGRRQPRARTARPSKPAIDMRPPLRAAAAYALYVLRILTRTEYDEDPYAWRALSRADPAASSSPVADRAAA